jgi:hypothetical protein
MMMFIYEVLFNFASIYGRIDIHIYDNPIFLDLCVIEVNTFSGLCLVIFC